MDLNHIQNQVGDMWGVWGGLGGGFGQKIQNTNRIGACESSTQCQYKYERGGGNCGAKLKSETKGLIQNLI